MSASNALRWPVHVERRWRFRVVRDDLLPGGTKLRGLQALYDSQPDVREWVYASPTFGYAQVALGFGVAHLDRAATVFIPQRRELHPYSALAESQGAKMVMVDPGYLATCQKRAADYAAEQDDRALVPFGLNCEPVIEAIADAARSIDPAPEEVWTVISSGTLSRSLQRAWPDAKIYGVRIGHDTTDNERGRAELVKAPEKFEQEAKHPPPWPSCSHYDAKLWQFARENASDDALIWNVAR